MASGWLIMYKDFEGYTISDFISSWAGCMLGRKGTTKKVIKEVWVKLAQPT